jgi:hypothetical protein
MTKTAAPAWEAMRTDETRMVEDKLKPHFERVDSYRYNSASIRVRVIDSRFEGNHKAEAGQDRMMSLKGRGIVVIQVLLEMRECPRSRPSRSLPSSFLDPPVPGGITPCQRS